MLHDQLPAVVDWQGEAPPPTLSGVSLFFDFDGTLVDLAPTPDAVVVEDTLVAALKRIAASAPGRVAIVSGRSLDTLDRLLGAVTTTLTVVGSHGAERRVPGAATWAAGRPIGLDAAADALRGYADANGLLFEPKSLGAAVHFRHRPAAEGDALAAAAAIAQRHALTLQHGKMMVELRSEGHKGDAVDALLATEALAGTRPLFFGDDVTDEDGFAAAARHGGAGVLVGERRETAAHFHLPDVAAVRAWIEQAIS